MQIGDLLYITPRIGNLGSGVFGIFQEQYKGNENLSLHGSPWYEDFIICMDPKTGKKQHYGSQDYAWRDAGGYIKCLQDNLHKIKNLCIC